MAKTSGTLIQLSAALMACVAGLNVAAQELPPPPSIDGMGMGETIQTPVDSTPLLDDGGLGAVDTGFDPSTPGIDLWEGVPAAVETTGTWLERGMWYGQVEAMMLVRQWDRQRTILAGDGTPATIFSPVTGGIINLGGFTNSDRSLSLGRSTPGREGSVRFTLGRFLHRDGSNNDHTMEFTVLGGGEFGQNEEVFTNDPNDPFDLVDSDPTLVNGTPLNPSLIVPDEIDLDAIISFDTAESMGVQYDSRLNSFELNYAMKTRLRNDQMVLLPNGQWVRRANGGFTYQFLAGVRYIDLTENLAWRANNIGAPQTVNVGGVVSTQQNVNGEYLIRTSNDIFGPQIGFGANIKGARFSLESLIKAGALANDLKTRSALSFSALTTGDQFNPAANNFTNSNRTDTISVLAEFSLIGRYHVTPNIAWRGGYHLLMLTHVALAPHQVNFEPDDNTISSTGDVFYHGLSTGIDFYW